MGNFLNAKFAKKAKDAKYRSGGGFLTAGCVVFIDMTPVPRDGMIGARIMRGG
jgi:hypothetical protein